MSVFLKVNVKEKGEMRWTTFKYIGQSVNQWKAQHHLTPDVMEWKVHSTVCIVFLVKKMIKKCHSQ